MSSTEFHTDEVRRAIIQRLEDCRRAGVTHWKQIAPAQPVENSDSRPLVAATNRPAAVLTATGSASPISTTVAPIPSASTVEKLSQTIPVPNALRSGDSESSDVAKKKTIAAQLSLVPRTPFQPLDLPLAERVAGLSALAERVKKCTRCQELASTRTQTVFGVGNPQAKILFVGEAPGADEDAQGEPFVGRSGQLLNDIIKACRIRREDIYICNVLRCRPPGNRLPAPDEAANCREYLDGQIAHVNPEYIVCWGACAAQNLLAVTDPIGKLRGRFHEFGRAKVLCTYHPSYLMRNPAAKKDVWEDMKRLFLDMGVDLTAKASG